MNWNEVRQNFPAAVNGVYLNSAANSPLHKSVYQAVATYYEHLHLHGEWDYWESLNCLQRTRRLMAQFIGAENADIGFGPNSSHNMSLLACLLKDYLLKNGKNKILLCQDEFPSSSFPWEAQGYEVVKVPTHHSFFDENDFDKAFDSKVGVLVVSHVQFATGFRSNLERLGQWAKENGLIFIVNATQSIGSFPIDVKHWQTDALVASCHKRMGAGTGLSVLYASAQLRELGRFPLIGWWSVPMEHAFSPMVSQIKTETSVMETGVVPFATVRALEAALNVFMEIGIEQIAQRTHELASAVIKLFNSLEENILSWTDEKDNWKQSHVSGNILIEHARAQQLFEYLNTKKVFIGTRAGGVRISVHCFNNFEDIETLGNKFKEFS